LTPGDRGKALKRKTVGAPPPQAMRSSDTRHRLLDARIADKVRSHRDHA